MFPSVTPTSRTTDNDVRRTMADDDSAELSMADDEPIIGLTQEEEAADMEKRQRRKQKYADWV